MEDTLFCHAYHCSGYVLYGDDNIAVSMFSKNIEDTDTRQRFLDTLDRESYPGDSYCYWKMKW